LRRDVQAGLVVFCAWILLVKEGIAMLVNPGPPALTRHAQPVSLNWLRSPDHPVYRDHD